MKNMFPKNMFGGEMSAFFGEGKKGKKGKGEKAEKGDKNPQILGSGSIEGGKYESVTISGSGEVEDDVEAESISVSGSGEFCGDVKAGEIEAAGSIEINGSVDAESFEIGGSSDIGGRLKAENIQVGGFCSVGKDVEAGLFDSSGGFEIGGGLKAREISIELNGQASAKRIEGEKIRVKQGEGRSSSSSGKSGTDASVRGGDAFVHVSSGGKGRSGAAAYARGGDAVGSGNRGGSVVNNSWGGSVKISKSGKASKGGDDHILEAELIEGDSVKLESTHADVVRGKKVKIGPKCKIGTVEYSESIEVDDDATVKKQVKS